MTTHRSPGRINPILIAFLIPLIVIVVTAVFLVVRHYRRADVESFDVKAYRSGPKELQGNRYKLDAQVETQLRSDDGFGRLLAVKPVDGSEPISVFLPNGITEDVRTGQRFHMIVMVKELGLIQVVSMDKY